MKCQIYFAGKISAVEKSKHTDLPPHLPLHHYTANTFYFTTQGEMRSGNRGAIFEVGGGQAVKVTLSCHNFNNKGLGEFTR
ncbi:MAG TPA: hypothetical protein VIS74_03005 [Chthoniobacterales bacterium]